MASSHFSLPVLYSSTHSDLDDDNEYSYSQDQKIPQKLYLPIPNIPFRRKLIKEEFKKFTDLISDQKIEINSQLLLLEEVQNQALCSITDRAKLYSEVIQLNKSLKKSKKNIDPSKKIIVREQAQQCQRNLKTAEEENVKIAKMVKENQKLSEQLEIKEKNLTKDHDMLMNQFLNTVSYEAKRQIRSLNDKLDVQERRLQNVSEQYEKKIQEKDQIIADLRVQLNEAQKQTSNYVITKRERLKRPSMIIRDNTNILHLREKNNDQTEKSEILQQKNKEHDNEHKHSKRKNSMSEGSSNYDSDKDDQRDVNSENSIKKKNDEYCSDELSDSYNNSESKSEKNDPDSGK